MTLGVEPKVDPDVIDLLPIVGIDVEEDEITGLQRSDVGRPGARIRDHDNPGSYGGHGERPAWQLSSALVVAAQRVAETVAIDKSDVARAVHGAVARCLRAPGCAVVEAPGDADRLYGRSRRRPMSPRRRKLFDSSTTPSRSSD